MKKYLIIGSLICLAFAACEPKQPAESFYGNESRPTWVAPQEHDMTVSMTAVVKVDLAAQYPNQAADFVRTSDDLLAAFAGETCLGVAEEVNGLYFIYIAGAEGDVTLRYYSAHYKNLFEAKDAFPFVNDTQLGTTAEPYIPKLQVVKQ